MKIQISISSEGARDEIINYIKTIKLIGNSFEVKPIPGKAGSRGVLKLRNPKKLQQIDGLVKTDLKDMGFSLLSKVNYGDDQWIKDGTNVTLSTDGSCYYQITVAD